MTNETMSIYGLVASFDDAESLVDAAERTREAGYQKVRAYSPFYVEGLGDALGENVSWIAWLVLGGLILGGLAAFGLQWWTSVPDVQYPLNVGGRPLNAWPAFMIITFEGAILGGGLAAAGAMLLGSGLPLPYHPIFNAPNIELASRSRFFLLVEEADPRFDLGGTQQFLESLNPIEVSEVTW